MQQQESATLVDTNPVAGRAAAGQMLLEEMAKAAGRPRDGWESLLSMDDERAVPVDHCAVLSEN
jgi:hypothetical protein